MVARHGILDLVHDIGHDDIKYFKNRIAGIKKQIKFVILERSSPRKKE